MAYAENTRYLSSFLKNVCACVLHTCMYMYYVCAYGSRRQQQIPWNCSYRCCELPNGCWKLNLGPLKSSQCSDSWAICPAPWYLIFICFAIKAVRMKWTKRGRHWENSSDRFVMALLMKRTLKLQSQETASLTTEAFPLPACNSWRVAAKAQQDSLLIKTRVVKEEVPGSISWRNRLYCVMIFSSVFFLTDFIKSYNTCRNTAELGQDWNVVKNNLKNINWKNNISVWRICNC